MRSLEEPLVCGLFQLELGHGLGSAICFFSLPQDYQSRRYEQQPANREHQATPLLSVRTMAMRLMPNTPNSFHLRNSLKLHPRLRFTHGFVKTDILPEKVDSITSTRNLRSTNNSIITYKVPKARTLCHQNSYMVRVSRVWNSLPDELREPDISFYTFKSRLFDYYYSATLTVFDHENPQTWK